MNSGGGDTPSRVPGSPIRTPPDQRSVDSSPGPIAASHVLHRLLVPRHPPCALTHLHTGHHARTNIKALQQKPRIIILIQDARIHYPVLKHPTTTPHPPRHRTPPPPHPTPRDEPRRPDAATSRRYVCGCGPATEETTNPHPTPPGREPHPPAAHSETEHRAGARGGRACLLRTQQCATPHTPGGPGRRHQPGPGHHAARGRLRCFHPRAHTRRRDRPREGVPEPRPHPLRGGGVGRLLRKEVIQPHLPVRLPCYDFVPIASPTFDHSLPERGWAMGFGCYRLS